MENKGSGPPNPGALRNALRQALAWDTAGLPVVVILGVYGLTTLTFFVFYLWLQRSSVEEPAATVLGGAIGALIWLALFFRRTWLILVINWRAHGKPVHLSASLSTTVRRLPVVLVCFGIMALPMFITSEMLVISPCLSPLLILLMAMWIPAIYITQALLLGGSSLWRAPVTAIRHIVTNWRHGLVLGLIAIPVSATLGSWQHKLITLEEYSYAPLAVVLSGLVLVFLESLWYGLIARYTAYALQAGNPVYGQRLGQHWPPLRSLGAMIAAGAIILAVAFTPPFHIFHRAIGGGALTQGGVWHDEGNHSAAIDAYQRALDAYRLASDSTGQATAHSKLADTYVALDRYDEAITHNLAAQALFPPGSTEPLALGLKANLGIIFRHQGRYDEAQALYEEILPEVRRSSDAPPMKRHELLSSLLVNISTVSFLQGRYDRAYDSLREALPLLRQQGDQESVARALANLSSADVYLGFWVEAIKDAEEALHIYEQEQVYDPAYEAVARLSLAIAFHRLGDPAHARDYGETGLKLSRIADDVANEGRVLSELSAIAFTVGEYDEALEYAEQAVVIAQRQDDGHALSIRLTTQALILLRLDRPSEAEALLKEALNIARAAQFKQGEAVALDGLGNAQMLTGQVDGAIDSYQTALAIEREMGNQLFEANTLANLGAAYLVADRRQEALQELETAASILEKERTSLNLPDLRASFLGNQQDIYALLVNILVEEGDYVRAFNYSEGARARAFLDQVMNGPVNFRVGANAQLLEKERELRDEIAALRIQLSSSMGGAATKATQARLQAELTEREADYEDLLLELQIHNPEAAALVSADAASLSDVQALLDPGVTLIEYFVTEGRTLAFIITRHTFETVALEVSREDLTRTIDEFRTDDFAVPSQSSPHPTSLRQLHMWLIDPLRPYLNTPDLGIIPHDVLHYLPFAALTDGERYLNDDYALFILPSASVLRFVQQKGKVGSDTLLALGNPTLADPLTEREVKAIADLYGTLPLVGREATESAVWAHAGKAGIVHMAAHGQYNKFNPLFSAIHLAPDEDNDGRLEVHEVYGLDLTTTDLVVLSACQTQLGELGSYGEPVGVTPGDEVVGLNRAFSYAGTSSVMASLWNVDDAATAFLMERFYTHLRAGMGKAKALRQAQIEVRAEYPHPYYWAAFALMGDPE